MIESAFVIDGEPAAKVLRRQAKARLLQLFYGWLPEIAGIVVGTAFALFVVWGTR